MKKMLTVALLCGGFAIMPAAFATADQVSGQTSQVSGNQVVADQVTGGQDTNGGIINGTHPVNAKQDNNHKVSTNDSKNSNVTNHVATKSMVVDINTADATMLSKGLKGIGLKKAEAIVAYRTKNGPFKTAEDLTKVKGISSHIVKNNIANITVD